VARLRHFVTDHTGSAVKLDHAAVELRSSAESGLMIATGRELWPRVRQVTGFYLSAMERRRSQNGWSVQRGSAVYATRWRNR
jgi:hypothetical protein